MSRWNEKIVVVTGGSDGLGLAIVTTFAEAGATVVSLARNQEKNLAALRPLSERGLNVTGLACDVTQDDQVKLTVDEIERQFAQIDVWINNVGKSTRADVMETGIEAYQQLMEINFYSVVRCWLACHVHLTKTSGTLVNIGSLASKTGFPFMAPYSTSKHALAAFSQQLRLEGPANVNVLHVCPGPIKRSSNEPRYVEESKGLPEAAKRAGAGTRVKGIAPEAIAKKIVRACEQRKRELVIPWSARLLFAISQLSSTCGDFLLGKMIKS